MTEQDPNDLSQWSDQSQSITLEQMDELVANLAAKRKAHAAAKAEATERYKELAEAENLLIGALKASGKKKYEMDGVGLVYISHKDTFPTPKTNEEKIALFNYIKQKYGPDVLMNMSGINHQTLNSWAKKEIEADPLVKIPGLGLPTTEEQLNFRSKE